MRTYVSCLFLSDILLSIMPSSFIHVVVNGRISFFPWLNDIPVCMCVCVCACVYLHVCARVWMACVRVCAYVCAHVCACVYVCTCMCVLTCVCMCVRIVCVCVRDIFFIHSSADEHFGCFQVIVIMLWWTWGCRYHFEVGDFISFEYILRSGITGSYGTSILTFWGTSVLFWYIVAVPIYIPMNNVQNESESLSVMPNSLRPHGLYSPWDSPDQNTGVGSRSLLRGIFSN